MTDIGLTEANFELFAAKHYDSVFPDTLEFKEDLKRFAYVKRLFNLYISKDELRERLILNHLQVIYNMWGDAATPMLFLKLNRYESILKTFLVYMNRMPNRIEGIGLEMRVIESDNITIHVELMGRLNEL